MEENAVADRSRAWNALVYALAVQGVTPTGWREPGLYTAILSAIIKVGRFMVVQKALEIAGLAVEGEEGEDSGEEFSSRGSAWDFKEEEEEEEEEEEDGASGYGRGDAGSSSSSRTGSTQDNCSSQDSSRTGST
ncbi:putative DNA helicase protein [Neofusicoccum parvum]|nr:putative DNA helicase protein [Neofusicoccum parvum]